MAYRHGVYANEVPTAVLPPQTVTSSLPVVFGTAPINLSKRDKAPVNEPVLCFTYQEAVEAFGYSEDWKNYTLSEFIYSQFALYRQAPVVLVNVLDPATHKKSVTGEEVELKNGAANTKKEGILESSVTVKSEDGTTTYEKNKDYELAFDNNGYLVVNVLEGGSIPSNTTKLQLDFNQLDPGAVNSSDIIGGVDQNGKVTGLELINQIFPRFRLVPGLIIAPGFSQDPAVAAVMAAKAGNINSHFKAQAVTDIPADKNYTEVPGWKETNNFTSERQFNCYPKLTLGGKKFNFSTHLAGVICATDEANDGIPYVSPSNQNLQVDGAVLDDGTEVFLGPDQAGYLNGNGIVTALNFVGGWKAWGNRTGAYPVVTDPKDSFIPLRRMFDWIQNTIILSTWQRLDRPINNRLIESITDSHNLWMNGLAAAGNILGGRVEFNASENPSTDLMDGIIRFHVYVTPPSPAREIDFIVEYDVNYLNGLFA